MNIIIYPQENNSLALVFPTGELPIEEVARKDVPAGVSYLIVSKDDFPEQSFEFADAWEADFSNPDGYGIGSDAWFAEQEAKKLEAENDNNQPE